MHVVGSCQVKYILVAFHYKRLDSELGHTHSPISEACKEMNVNLENHVRLSRKKTTQKCMKFNKMVQVKLCVKASHIEESGIKREGKSKFGILSSKREHHHI